MPCGRCSPGSAEEREDSATHRQRERSGQRDDAVVADHHTGSGQTVNSEQRRHHGEGDADEHDASVLASHADDRQRHSRCRGHDGADPDTEEVHVRPQGVRVLPEEEEARPGHNGRRSDERQVLGHAIPRERPHQTQIGCGARYIESHLS